MFRKIGAQKRTRTSTPLRVLAPEASASTIPPSGQQITCCVTYGAHHSVSTRFAGILQALGQRTKIAGDLVAKSRDVVPCLMGIGGVNPNATNSEATHV